MYKPSNAELKRLIRSKFSFGKPILRIHRGTPSLFAALLSLTSGVLVTFSMFYEKDSSQFYWLCVTAFLSYQACLFAMIFGSWEYQNEHGQFAEYISQNWVLNTICSFLCGGGFIGVLVHLYTSAHYMIMTHCYKNMTEISRWMPCTLLFMHFVVFIILLKNRVEKFLKVWNCKRFNLDEQFPS